MKLAAITVWAPYAGQILDGTKIIENRAWNTEYRGPLLIHSGKRAEPGHQKAPRGVLGVVRLVEVHKIDGLDACRPDRGAVTHAAHVGGYTHHLVLADPYWFEQPIAYPGRQMLWYPKPGLARTALAVSREWEGWEL